VGYGESLIASNAAINDSVRCMLEFLAAIAIEGLPLSGEFLHNSPRIALPRIAPV
jgi:hypothetical protein